MKIIPQETIQNKIFFIRGKKVMLDKDLAELYGVKTEQLTRQVRRNINRFPEDFLLQLTREEFKNLICHFARSSWGGTRKLPYAFTEHGILMLSSVLNSRRAILVNYTSSPFYLLAKFWGILGSLGLKSFKLRKTLGPCTRGKLLFYTSGMSLQSEKYLVNRGSRNSGFKALTSRAWPV